MYTRRSILLGVAALAGSQRVLGADSKKWKAGTHYTEVTPAQPTATDPDKPEVIEFFWYGCPHCYTLEPHLVLWEHNKPVDVNFLRIPVAWRAERVPHARLFYALKALKREDLHGEVFDTIHRRRIPLQTVEEQSAFVQARGIDPAQYANAYQSASIDTELNRAGSISKSYRIASVPTVAINGRYASDVVKAGSEARLVSLTSNLAERGP